MPRFSFARLKSFGALLLIPVVFAACSQNNVTVDESLGKYFDSAGVKGSFGLFDNGQGHFSIYNLPRFRDSAYQPAATFDILLSLIGIQTGVVKDDSAIVFSATSYPPLTATPNPQPLTLREAFHWPTDIGFIELARRIGKDTLKRWVDSLSYGTKYIAGDSFWQDNHLKITADEQLGLIKKLYFNQLPFFQHTQKMVVAMMPSEGNANYRLYYKTALGRKEDGHPIGWVLGWIEENKHPYFFVVNFESADEKASLPGTGLAITRGILGRLGFFNGTK
jgi:beta-lactamase class D